MNLSESKTLDLLPFDQTIVRVYIRKLFGFAFTESSKKPEAVMHRNAASLQLWRNGRS